MEKVNGCDILMPKWPIFLLSKIIALKNLSNRANLAWKNLKDADIRSYLERNDKGSSREDISQPARYVRYMYCIHACIHEWLQDGSMWR